MQKRKMSHKKNPYFNIVADIKMLRLMLQFNPLANPLAWEGVLQGLQSADFKCTMRQLKHRIQLLISKYRREEIASMNKSGTEEQWIERANLLHRVIEMENGSSNFTSISGMEHEQQFDENVIWPQVITADDDNKASTFNERLMTDDQSSNCSSIHIEQQPKRNLGDLAEDQIHKKMKYDHLFRMQQLQSEREHKERESKCQQMKMEKELELDRQRIELEQQRLELEKQRMENEQQQRERDHQLEERRLLLMQQQIEWQQQQLRTQVELQQQHMQSQKVLLEMLTTALGKKD